MLRKLLRKKIKSDLVVVDPVFPQKDPFSFRNAEINEYLARIDNCESYAMYPMKPGPEAWFEHGYGVAEQVFTENKAGYLKHYPQNRDKIKYLDPHRNYEFKLSYSYFLAETYTLLPFYETNRTPFVFVLYPGGGFGLNNAASDAMLRRIFQSPYFRKVIVTQQITRDYLSSRQLCPASKIEYIYGGFVQFKPSEVQAKQLYPGSKSTFDICFVAAKYSPGGVDKGYDLFIAAAKALAEVADDIMFHVVGGFDESDANIAGLESRITFYGYRQPDFLRDFYAKMDIFLAPNRPGQLFEGNFDGFPLGIDAGYCGVALFVADELKMNHHYADARDIVLIPLSESQISRKILYYYKHLEELYALSAAGRVRTQKLFDINHQVDERIKVFEEFTDLQVHN